MSETTATEPDKQCNDAGAPLPDDDYKMIGKIIDIHGLNTYYNKNPNSKKIFIFLYDIFGWNKTNRNVFRFCDLLAKKTEVSVIMPDFYRGEPWSIEDFPLDDNETKKACFGLWIKSVASDIVVRKDVYEKILPWIYDNKYEKISLGGTCWGGGQAFKLGSDDYRFKSVVTMHAAFITQPLCDALNVPVMYCPAKGDVPAKSVQKFLEKKSIRKKCEYFEFPNEVHGFCAARGDWTNVNTKKAVDKVLDESVKFLKKTM